MSEILHTNTCSTRLTTAEALSKTSLNPDPECPRCILNAAAPQLLAACEWMYSFFENELIQDEDCKEFAKVAIAAAKGD